MAANLGEIGLPRNKPLTRFPNSNYIAHLTAKKTVLKKHSTLISLLLILGLFIFLTLNKHSKSGLFNYHSEIWADKAGYYVYLPATFIYDFKGSNLPDSICTKTGDGFSVNPANKIATKYTYGVAMLQAPFFLVAHLLSDNFGYEPNGFSKIYHRSIDVAAVCYLVGGLFFLFLFLRNYFAKGAAITTLFMLVVGTNLYYYAVQETGMSHVYSFVLVAWALHQTLQLAKRNKSSQALTLAFIIGLIIIVRPINILVIPGLVFFYYQEKGSFKNISLKYCSFLILVPAILFIPQFLYWNFVSGHYFYYSYQGEGFTNLLSPEIIKFWFSTRCGVFFYTPLFLIFLLGLFALRKEHAPKAIFLLVYFIGLSYIFSSWWSWNYGCSYGSRPMVEYLPFFCFPLAAVLHRLLLNRTLPLIIPFYLLLALLVVLNLKVTYSFDGCWYGGDWDFTEFRRITHF